MRIHVERQGSGTPILVLHGLMSDHRQVIPLLPALRHCEAFLPDLPGCGRSDKEPSPAVVEDTAKELRALCRAHGIETVIAYSISGLIAFELQLPNTILISAFCTNPLTEGALKPLHGREKQIESFLRRHESRAQQFINNLQSEPVPGAKDASVPCAIEYLHAATVDNTKKAEALQRVLVIHGTQDKLIDYRLGMQLAACARAEFVAVPEGHISVLKNETAHQAISAFVRARDA